MNKVEIYKMDNEMALEVRFDGETVWLNQHQLADLFESDRTSILKHLKNIYADGELNETSTCAKITQVREEGKRLVTRNLLNYNLDAILSVGYHVNSKRGAQFRQWANQQLNESLAALTLFIATSKSDEMEIVKRFIINILNGGE